MKQLIRFELYKLLKKPLAVVSLAGLALFVLSILFSQVFISAAQVEQEGTINILVGKDAVACNQEIAALFQGPLTIQKIQDIITYSSFSDTAMAEKGMDPEIEILYTHNDLYSIFNYRNFISLDGEYNGATMKAVFGDIAPDLICGYSVGWEQTTYALLNVFIVWSLVLIILLSPVFSEEYTLRTDALLLTGKKGKSLCPLAKLAAAYGIAIAGSLLLIAVFFVSLVSYHGITGFETSAQLGCQDIFYSVPYLISWGEAFAFSCLLWITAVTVLTSIVLTVSALAKNSFVTLVICTAAYVIPASVPWYKAPPVLQLIGSLFPVNQMHLSFLFCLEPIRIAGISVPVMWVSLPVALFFLLAGGSYAKKVFAGHQVM